MNTTPVEIPESTATPEVTQTAQQAEPQKDRKNRGRLIAAGVTAAALVIGGGAFAIGAAVGSHGSHPSILNSSGTAQEKRPGDDVTGAVSTDPTALRAAAEAAIADTGAVGATSIDVEHNGYEIELRLQDGSELDAFVSTNGDVSKGAPTSDSDNDPLLDLSKLQQISDASLAASVPVGGTDGRLDSISSSNDPGVTYEVTVYLASGKDAEISLADDLTVVSATVGD